VAFVIFGDAFTFPDGNAATNRVFTYAKGFTENGVSTHVICFRNDLINDYNGISNDIFYYHPYGQTKRNKYFLVRRWLTLRKYVRTFMLVRRINKNDKIIALHLYTYRFSTHLAAYLAAKSVNAKVTIERCEHPLREYKYKILVQTLGNLKFSLETNLCDAIFCISDYLIDFYRKRGFTKKKILLVPSTVDAGRFNGHFDPPLPYEYIAYCGSLTLAKDGVNILIESFMKISHKYPEIKLVIIGKGDTEEEEEAVKSLTIELKAGNRIIFTGQMSRTEIPSYLCNARVLALARPRSRIADAGFPSKLTEYLATGKPVVVTKVGEIPVYLKDNETAFLSEPDSVNAFADRLDYALKNYEFARQVGKRGKELAGTIFSYNFQAKNMMEFISKL
jgi:glycosyltransferase involved in cell wall biosynthesis